MLADVPTPWQTSQMHSSLPLLPTDEPIEVVLDALCRLPTSRFTRARPCVMVMVCSVLPLNWAAGCNCGSSGWLISGPFGWMGWKRSEINALKKPVSSYFYGVFAFESIPEASNAFVLKPGIQSEFICIFENLYFLPPLVIQYIIIHSKGSKKKKIRMGESR